MQYLLLGITLFIIFSLLTMMLISWSHSNWQNDLKNGKLSSQHDKIAQDTDKVFYAISILTKGFILKFNNLKLFLINKYMKNSTERNNLPKTILNTVKEILILIGNKIIFMFKKIVEIIRPIDTKTHNQFNYNSNMGQQYRDSSDENDELVKNVIFEPEIILDRRNIKPQPYKPFSSAQAPRNTHTSQEPIVNIDINSSEFKKIESRLISKMEREKGKSKFLTALELGDLYGKAGSGDEQRELYRWAMEKGDEEIRKAASFRLIGM